MGLLLLLLYSHHANVNNPQSVPYPAAQKPDIRNRLIGEYRLAPNLSPSLASLQYLLVTRPIIMPASQLSGTHSCFRGRPILYAMRAPHPSIMSPASSIPKTQNKDRRLPAACIPWPVPTTSKKVFGDVAGECVLRKPNRAGILQVDGIRITGCVSYFFAFESHVVVLEHRKMYAAWRTQNRNQK